MLADALPDDLSAAHAMILELTAVLKEKDEAVATQREAIAQRDEALLDRDVEVARLTLIIKKLQRLQFGKRSEKLDPDQLALGLEDVETAVAGAQAAAALRPRRQARAPRSDEAPRRRCKLPEHLPRVEVVIDIDDKTCPCCGAALHRIGEDVSERLDVVPARHQVLVTRRPKYACRGCTDGVVQAPAPPRLIESGLPTEAMIASVLVSKYADHCPLYRQHQILARQGIAFDRSAMAEWVGRAAFLLRPIAERMLFLLKQSGKLFCDETGVPVLDPGRGRTKKGYLWAVARDDRAWNGTIEQGSGPPGVVYVYAPGRSGEHARAALAGFSGVLQVDGYAGYNALNDDPKKAPPVTLAFCWAHWRRDFFELAEAGDAPIAREALAEIAKLYAVEDDIRGRSADERRAIRLEKSKPLVDALFAFLEKKLERLSKGSDLATAIRYGIKRREGLTRFLEDGRIEMDSNPVERLIRPVTLNRKNALFAGSDEGGTNWGAIASLIETCKLNRVEPGAYLADILAKLVNAWPNSRLDDLLPWKYAVA
jgi:transposase